MKPLLLMLTLLTLFSCGSSNSTYSYRDKFYARCVTINQVYKPNYPVAVYGLPNCYRHYSYFEFRNLSYRFNLFWVD